MRVRGLHHPQRALRTGIEQQIHVALGHLEEGSDGAERLRVQYEPIEIPEPFDACVDDLERAIPIGNIGDESEAVDAVRAQLCRGLVEALGLAPGDDESRAESSQMLGETQADASGATGDDDDSSIEIVRGSRGHGGSVVSWAMATTWNPGPRPEWVEAVNAGLIVPIAVEAELPLSREGLIGEALARQGRADEGIAALCAPGPGTGDDFLEGLDIALASLESEANLHLLGRWITRRFLLRLLEVRLQICDWVRSDPGVRDEEVAEPLFVVGAPRTGTTVLHALLSADHRHRVPLGWEFLRPVPPPTYARREDDPRIALADAELRGPQLVTGGLDAIHAYAGRMNKECLSAMSFAFRSEEFISRYNTPSYIKWLQGCDMRPAYEMHRLVLQILQRRMPTQKWILKSPVHLHNLPVLLGVYPDAQLVITHRDPLAILGSVTSLIATLRWAHSDDVDTRVIGRYHADLYWRDLDGLVDLIDGDHLPHERIAHGSFVEFNRDGVGVVERMYEQLGIDLPSEVRVAMTDALAGSPREKHGDHSWSFEWLGLDDEEQRTRFQRYSTRFDVGLTS